MCTNCTVYTITYYNSAVTCLYSEDTSRQPLEIKFPLFKPVTVLLLVLPQYALVSIRGKGTKNMQYLKAIDCLLKTQSPVSHFPMGYSSGIPVA